ncbi:MAG: PH domain-containing protein, partial [Bacteroidota bacterium]
RGMYFAMFFGGITLISLIYSLIAFFKYYFYIKDDSLIIEKGVITKTKTSVPFDRIQTVNFEQNFLQQIVGVVAVKIDTAGSKGNEFDMSALEKDKAEELRNYILSNKKEIVIDDAGKQVAIVKEEKKTLLMRLNPIDLLKVGVSQNHLRTFGILFFFGLSAMEELERALKVNLFDRVEEFGSGYTSSFIAIIGVAIFILIFTFIISLINTVLRYFDLQFFKTNKGFKLVAGLFNRKEQAAMNHKIQMINWKTNPIRKAFGMYTLSLRQAAASEIDAKKTVQIPGLYGPQLEVVKKTYYPAYGRETFTEHKMSVSFLYRAIFYYALLPSLIVACISYGSYLFPEEYTFPIWAPLPTFIILVLLLFFYWKNWRLKIDHEALQVHSGIIGKYDTLVKHFKVQNVEITTNIYQRR